MDNFLYDAGDYVIDDEAEQVEDAMEDLIEDDYSDIDNIANIDDESDEDDFEVEDLDEDDDFDDDDDYVDYEV